MKGLKFKKLWLASQFTAKAFGDKKRKLEGIPAIFHSDNVCKIIMDLDEWDFVDSDIDPRKYYLSRADYARLRDRTLQNKKEIEHLEWLWEMMCKEYKDEHQIELPNRFQRISVENFHLLLRYKKLLTAISGQCHDLIEDTAVTAEQIFEQFGPEVLRLTLSCTETDKELPWEDRKMRTIEMVKAADRQVKIIEGADKWDNQLSIEKQLLIKPEKEVWSAFSRGKDEQCWYAEKFVRALLENETNPPMFFGSLMRTVQRIFKVEFDLAPEVLAKISSL